MQKKMGTSQVYNHANGMNYDRILPDLIVGSCLQVPADADKCAPPVLSESNVSRPSLRAADLSFWQHVLQTLCRSVSVLYHCPFSAGVRAST